MALLAEWVKSFGLPAALVMWLVVWLTRDVTRELRALRGLLQQQTIVMAVILKTLDVPEAATLLTPPLGVPILQGGP